MRSFVAEHHLGTVRLAPLPVRLWPGKIREPDILYMARDHHDRIGEQAYGPPDLVVKVLAALLEGAVERGKLAEAEEVTWANLVVRGRRR